MLTFLKRLFGANPAEPPVGQGSPRTAVAGRERAEAGLRPSEEQFAQLVAGVRDYAVFLLDRGGHILTWNAGAERIKGFRPEDIIGRHFSTFYPKEAVSSGWPAHELKVAAQTGRFEDEGWRVRKDGSRFWASVVITALRDEAGEIRGFLKITRDMTDRKQAEQKLRLSEERFRLLVEGVREYAIFMLDPEGRVATWNAGAQRIKGYTAEEIIGEHFSRFYPPEDVQSGKPSRELEIAAATGKYEEEGWRVRKDGTLFWASVVITALRDSSGVLRGFAKVTRDMTERKRAEENTRRLLQEEAARQAAEVSAREARRAQLEERRQREQLNVTLASIGDAVIVTDKAGVVTFLNPVAVALTAWPPEEAAGQPLERVFHIVNEETRQAVESPVTKVLREGMVVGLANHTILITRGGREIAIDDSGAPIRGEDGAIAGVVLVFRDVTEARRAVEARLQLAAIVESSDDAIIGQGLDGTITSWNQGAQRLYGYTPEEIVGRPLATLVPPDHPDELPEILERIKRGERIEHFETRRVRKDGGRLDVALTISPIKNAEGEIVGASKIARDITARKRHEAALRFLAEASKVLAELLDVPSTLQKVAGLAVPAFADWCAVGIAEPDGSLRRVAVAHADASRVALAQELSRRYPARPTDPHGPAHVLATGRSEMMAEITDEILAAGARDGKHLRTLRELGFRSYISVPLAARGGRVLGVLTFLTAESGRRFGPDDLRVAEDLAQRAAIAVENARLYGELKEADRQKNDWIAMLAHELRNPLAPIRNALHIMKMPGVNGGTVERARQMTERQVDHMVRLVDDLLDVSRIIRGRIELRKEPVELAVVVARAVETAQPIFDARGQELITSVPAEPVRLEGDPTRLAQVLSNLLNNAAKFSERPGRIWLTADRQGAEAVLRVRDEGVGIRAELLPHVFEVFTQGDRSLERSQGGLGLGLTVVRKLVELHGGTVTAHSEGPGKGSEFVVRLPGVLDTSAPAAAEAAPGAGRAARARRVLVVDDNADAADSLAQLLRMQGHDVRVAYNGPEALAAAEEYRPEVVVLDIGLPGMSGYEVAGRLRQNPKFGRTLLVAVTGYGQQSDRRKSHDAGFDEHLVKPVDPHALQQALAARK
jgi:PAS domain S-box-containing protein